MAESSACLLRSYSQPCSASPQTNQGDPFRCLTSSISFGRYMSESLDWEKWSTFTENRYMEDVKKYSRPGSVAQMKAHFEAHYKKKAAERAATLLEQHNAVNKSNVDQDSMQMEYQVSRGKARDEEATKNMVWGSVEVSRCTPPRGEEPAAEGAQFDEAEENRLVDQVDISNCLENVEESQAIGYNQNIHGREQDSAQFVKVENICTSDKVDVCVPFRSTEDDETGAYCEDEKRQIKTTGELGGPASLDENKPVFSPFKSRGHNHIGVPKPPAPPKPSVPIKKRQHRKANSGSKENAADVENRKALTRSLHIPLDLAPKETKKPLSPILQRLVNSRLVKTLTGKAAKATQGKTLRDNIDTPEHQAVGLKQNKISSKSTTCTRDVQSHTVSRPFSFKSEERAAKRKEFFWRLEQNAKGKETEKDIRQENLKVKERNDFKYKPTLTTSKVGPCSDSFRPRIPYDASKKTKEAYIKLEGSKREYNQSPAYPLKSFSKKSPGENASPNILL